MTLLKLIALITMAADHVGFVFGIPVLRLIGRACFPIFAFTTAYGFQKTHDVREYIRRVMLMAVLSQLPFLGMYYCAGALNEPAWTFSNLTFLIGMGLVLWGLYMFGRRYNPPLNRHVTVSDAVLLAVYFAVRLVTPQTNVLYTLATALMMLQALNRKDMQFVEKLVIVSGLFISQGIFCDYSLFGVLLVLGLWLFRPDGFMMKLDWEIAHYMQYFVFVVWAVSMGAFYQSQNDVWGMLAGGGIVFLYMEVTRQRPAPGWMKQLTYWFYPVHLAVLDTAALCMGWPR